MKKYLKPELNMEILDLEDVLTISGEEQLLKEATFGGESTEFNTDWIKYDMEY